MFIIKCQYCGERDQQEFKDGGEAHIERPKQHTEVSDDEWEEYLFMRKNIKGIKVERWNDAHGRSKCINIARNTSKDEIKAMRCASVACENSVNLMEHFSREKVPSGSISETEICSVLHAENIKRGGEWIETRLLASGPRTNPWFQECGPRITRNNEIIAFDTDLVGCYGICVAISRTWWLGDKNPRPDKIYAMQQA